tara:strand:+ start:1515 stop:1763 length:249 start_codon:yes stop_codon:yes gene_type:complete
MSKFDNDENQNADCQLKFVQPDPIDAPVLVPQTIVANAVCVIFLVTSLHTSQDVQKTRAKQIIFRQWLTTIKHGDNREMKPE